MGKIKVLSEHISNKIAAGEVVERPASVIKELVENSIDAASNVITIEIKDGGKTFIRVTDNGSGIPENDTVVAFERHATSKIETSEDLDSIMTLGFRGEALASISSVSQVELITKTKDDIIGTLVEVNGGEVVKKQEIGCPDGTTIIIKNLFFNTPARLKFLKKDSTEAGFISNHVERLALTHPEISFKLISNNKQVIYTPGNGDILTTILSVFGKEFARSMIPIEYEQNNILIKGFIGKPEISRSNRNYQCIFINKRYIKDKIISSAIDNAFKTLVTINKYPSVVLYIDINPTNVDVNVHPSKMEVRFDDEKMIYDIVYKAIYETLNSSVLIPNIKLDVLHTKSNNEILEKEDIKPQRRGLEELFIKPPRHEYIMPKQINNETIKEEYMPYKSNGTYIQNNKNDKIITTYKATPNDNAISQTKSEDKLLTSTDDNVTKEQTLIPIADNKIKEQILMPIEDNQQQIELDYNFKIIGQLFSTYLIIEIEDKMFLIDQHAAHERLKYNTLSEKYENGDILSQTLISPIPVDLSLDEYAKVEENIELFNKIGYEIEPFGDSTYLIRSVPFILDTNYSKDYFIEVIDLLSDKKIGSILDLREGILSTMACKSAVKANEKLTNDEIKELINNILANKNTLTCPHGRPVIISITKYEIEKMFKRIQ